MTVNLENNKPKTHLLFLVHILALVFGGGLLRFIYGYQVSILFWVGLLMLVSSITFILLQLSNSKVIRTFINISYVFVSLVSVVICNLHLQNESNYGSFISESMIAIFQSNLFEMFSYIDQFATIQVLYVALVWLLLIYLSYFYAVKCSKKSQQLILPMVSGVLSMAATYAYSADIRMLLAEAESYSDVLNKFSESREGFQRDFEARNISSDFDGNIILVIGESTTRHHMSIYNYFRNTTPKLKERQKDIVVFNDIISTHSHTTQSLSDALVLNNRINRDSIYNKADLINVIKKAGFTTSWLSNQNATGVWDNVVSVASREADNVKFHSSSYGREFFRDVYDHALVDTLRETLNKNSTRQFVVMHTMAGHFPYCGLLPEEFMSKTNSFEVKIDEAVYGMALSGLSNNPNKEEITKQYRESVDCYDSAMIYIDSMLSEIMDEVSQLDKPSLVVYVADHGEAPLLNSGHESRMHSHFHVEVPFIVYPNEAYKTLYPEKFKSMKNNVDEKGSLIDLSYTLLGMLNVQGVDEANTRNITSNDYIDFNRATMHEKVLYDTYGESSDQVERTRGALAQLDLGSKQKVWAHRINTLGSLMQAADIFDGVEMDIFFDKKLKIYHPPIKDVGLTYETMLSMDNGKRKYWLDVKNLTNDNKQDILFQLNALDKKYELKKRTLFETDNIEAAGSLTKDGWHVSYYLPTDRGVSALISEEEKQKYASFVKAKLLTNNVGALSFDVRLMPIYKDYLIDFVKRNELKVYVWNHRLRVDRIDSLPGIKEFVDRSDIDAMLVNFPSAFDR